MSVLDSVLREEYDRSKRMKVAMEKELSTLPVGYLSKKTINNKTYYYIQKRDGSKIVSSYIPLEKFQQIKDQVLRRKQLERSIREININIKKIERIIR